MDQGQGLLCLKHPNEQESFHPGISWESTIASVGCFVLGHHWTCLTIVHHLAMCHLVFRLIAQFSFHGALVSPWNPPIRPQVNQNWHKEKGGQVSPLQPVANICWFQPLKCQDLLLFWVIDDLTWRDFWVFVVLLLIGQKKLLDEDTGF